MSLLRAPPPPFPPPSLPPPTRPLSPGPSLQKPLRTLAIQAAEVQGEGEPLMMAGTKMPSVVFYAQRPVAFFDTAVEARRVLREEAAEGVQSGLLLSEAALVTRGVQSGASVVGHQGGYVLLRVPR